MAVTQATPTYPRCQRSLPSPTINAPVLTVTCACGQRSEVRLIGTGLEVRPADARTERKRTKTNRRNHGEARCDQ